MHHACGKLKGYVGPEDITRARLIVEAAKDVSQPDNCRQLAKDMEVSLENSTAWTLVAHIRGLTRSLART